MTAIWRFALVALVVSSFVTVAAVLMLRAARWQARAPVELRRAQEAVEQFGGGEGLAERHQALLEIKQRLELERRAKSSDSGRFSNRLDELFAAHHLALASSTRWQAAPELAGAEATAFERTFTGSGRFADLLAFVRTLEAWPDRPEVRALTIEPESQGVVGFTLEIAVVRLARRDEEQEQS